MPIPIIPVMSILARNVADFPTIRYWSRDQEVACVASNVVPKVRRLFGQANLLCPVKLHIILGEILLSITYTLRVYHFALFCCIVH